MLKNDYLLINQNHYAPHLPPLAEKLNALQKNSVTYQKEIHKDSRFAICRYLIEFIDGHYQLTYDPIKSQRASTEKKANTDPSILHCESVEKIIHQFLADIGKSTLNRVEVKLIQTEIFPFKFNIHRDSQFKRLRHIQYLTTVLISASGIEGGEMQLFHSENDMLGPFSMIEEIPTLAGTGYIVDETQKRIFHGMKTAIKLDETAHRAALLMRFFE